MAETSAERRGLRVAVTGATGDLAGLLLPLLDQDPRVESILVLDVAKPQGRKIDFRRVELTRHDADTELAGALAEQQVDALYHLALLSGRVHDGAFAHELEVIGSMAVLAAAARARLPRLIVPSLTALYGARSQSPCLLREEAPLAGSPGSRFISDKVEVEQQLRAFRERNPDTRVLVLRLAPPLGPRLDNPATRLLARRVVPTLLGFDPLWQALHEDDAARALHLALTADADGAFNIVGEGVLPLSALIREAGGQPLPLPGPVARAALRALNAVGTGILPLNMLDYIHYSWVADGQRARDALGFVPQHHARDAAAALRRS
jgi:UDP-glucose 4-epimerase